MAENIRFHYLHRDSDNYKKFGSKDFSNPDHLSIIEIEKMLRSYLIDGMYFYPEKVGINKFRFHRYCDDYSWYEMEFIENVDGKANRTSIDDFFNLLSQNNH